MKLKPLILTLSLALTLPPKIYADSQWTQCRIDSDCKAVPGDACHGPVAINKKSVAQYLKDHKNAHADELCVYDEEKQKKDKTKTAHCEAERCLMK